MLDDPGDGSVFDSIWEKITDKFAVFFPLRIIRQSESLTIHDYRPTFFMFLTVAGFAAFTVMFFLFLFKFEMPDSLALWLTGIPSLVFLALTFRGTVREVYYFDKATDSYAFVRQFIHRSEFTKGSIGQFTGAYVKTQQNGHDESDTYFVVLQQEGMFLSGASEQTLREEVPIFNSFDREARIASAISGFVHSKNYANEAKSES